MANPSSFRVNGIWAGGPIAGDITPSVNDGAALGTAALSWSDLFLASGGVINWNNGDVTLTHSAGALTLNSGTSTFGWSDIKMQRAGSNRVLFTTGAADYFDINAGTVLVPAGATFIARDSINLGGAAGAATTRRSIAKKVTGIADNTATDVFTVTVPNANHAAAIRIVFLSSNGSTDAFESARVAIGTVVLTRTSGVATVATAVALSDAGIATVAAGATHTLAYGVTAMTGAVGATQTFTIQVTIDDSGNTGSNQVVAVAELLNAEASGVTIA